MRRLATLGSAAAFSFMVQLSSTSGAQIVNPADAHRAGVASDSVGAARGAGVDTQGTHHSWMLPAVVVYGKRPGLHDEDLVGAAEQPRWTTKRPFSETRVYVIPEGQFEFEYWVKPTIPDKGSTEIETLYEFEMGLPHRLQIDLYIVSHKSGDQGPVRFDEQKFEVRWAFAKWGRIAANPTLYLEWAQQDEAPDHFESKLLFGGGILPRLHWAANLVFEHETGGAQENSQELTLGASWTAVDQTLALGIEGKFAFVDDKATRGDYVHEFLLGPSLQHRPLPPMHIDLAPLVGLTDASPRFKGIMVLGWEF